MKKRLFVAIELPPDLRRAYRQYASAEAGRWPGARWTADDNLHVTVLFLGGVDEAAVTDLAGDLGRAAASTASFTMAHEALMLAPPGRRPPTMIWATFSGREPYAVLVGTISSSTKRHAPDAATDKEPLPHVTLARSKDKVIAPRGQDVRQLPQTPESFLVNEILLVESRLTPSGPVYTVVHKFGLN